MSNEDSKSGKYVARVIGKMSFEESFTRSSFMNILYFKGNSEG